ncbi:Hypothetical protein SMAX5B_021263 [Scophthalmus maximus]|uniref:Uncharacterized protein n=1 Tax=Scophthalmus maximus TaxID=52904 RepID=A0A2U9BV72_SCOMX|nr:Hypothetical protein SMAX5B_021263 [Scophthalmus maximus]
MRVIFILNAGFVAAFSPRRRESPMLAAFGMSDHVNQSELTADRARQSAEE